MLPITRNPCCPSLETYITHHSKPLLEVHLSTCFDSSSKLLLCFHYPGWKAHWTSYKRSTRKWGDSQCIQGFIKKLWRSWTSHYRQRLQSWFFNYRITKTSKEVRGWVQETSTSEWDRAGPLTIWLHQLCHLCVCLKGSWKDDWTIEIGEWRATNCKRTFGGLGIKR